MNTYQLISKLRAAHRDHDTTGFDCFDFVHAFGSGREALLYAKLFWPDFSELNGMVFLKSAIETDDDRRRVADAFKRYNNDLVKTEQSFNFVEIPSLFGRHLSETDDEEDRLLADILCEIWHTRLHTLFAGRSFHVAILEPKETGGELGLIFHQNLSIKCKIP